MHSMLLLGMLVFSTAPLFSQGKFTPGYVVSNNGDTLRGEIEKKDWKVNPSSIRFRKSNTSEPTEYFTTEIKSFYLTRDGELFRSFRMALDQAPTDPQRITEKNYNAKEEKTFFATVAVTGIASLFYVYDFKPHFIIEKDGIFQELIVQQKLTTVKSTPSTIPGVKAERDVLLTIDLYKGQLSSLFSDCPSLTKRIKTVPFRLNKLKELVAEYNKCTKTQQ